MPLLLKSSFIIDKKSNIGDSGIMTISLIQRGKRVPQILWIDLVWNNCIDDFLRLVITRYRLAIILNSWLLFCASIYKAVLFNKTGVFEASVHSQFLPLMEKMTFFLQFLVFVSSPQSSPPPPPIANISFWIFFIYTLFLLTELSHATQMKTSLN